MIAWWWSLACVQWWLVTHTRHSREQQLQHNRVWVVGGIIVTQVIRIEPRTVVAQEL